MSFISELSRIRGKLFAAINLSYRTGGKSTRVDDGVFSISLPGFNASDSGWRIDLYCSSLGAYRNSKWTGLYLGDVIERVEVDVDHWLWEEKENAKQEGLSDEEIKDLISYGENEAKKVSI